MWMRSDAAVAMAWQSAPWGARMKKPDAAVAAAAPPADLAGGEDRTLIAAFQAGRREAFDLIVERHQRHVYQLCYRFVNNHEDAADLAQDVFVRAFKGLGKFKGDSSLATWLHRIGVNACLSRVAVKKPETEPVDAAPRMDTRAVNPLDEVLRGERAVAVRSAIARLPPKQRATLVLRVYREYSHEEIAGLLGSSVGAVKANFFHAVGNLRRLLQS